MKEYFCITCLTISSIVFSQTNFEDGFDNMLIEYTFKMAFSNYEYDTQLFLNESFAEYTEIRKDTAIVKGNFKTNIPFLKYINRYIFSSNLVQEQRTLAKGTQLYSSWSQEMEWEITSDTIEINGLKAIKAYTPSIEVERDNPYYYGKAIAWYSPDIPIPAGPGRYYGLPGLILKLTYEKYPAIYSLKSVKTNVDFLNHIFDTKNKVEKEDVIYYFHKNKDLIKSLK